MNKRVYLFLKKMFKNQEKRKINGIIAILEKKLSQEEIEELNIKYNDEIEKIYYNEIDIKFLILTQNKNLFTNEEFNYYMNLLGLKRFMKK